MCAICEVCGQNLAVNLRIIFAELKRRNVYKVAIAYGVVAWLLIQIATQVFPFFEIPNWAVRLIVLVIIVGFPIALIIAWAFELTPGYSCQTSNLSIANDGRNTGLVLQIERWI